MWDNIEKGFQAAFEEAWESYKNKTIPIGVAILDKHDNIMATGRNQVNSEGTGLIKFHQIAHAEINAILNLSEINNEEVHNNIRTFTLYSTMEPCPLCFGAIVMGSIRNVKYAARDNYAGAAKLNESIDYIKNKKISINGPYYELEKIQIAMQTCHELREDNPRVRDMVLPSWKMICDEGVQLGEYLHDNGILEKMAKYPFRDIYEYIISI